MDMGIHSLDLIDFLIGEIDAVSSFNNNYKKIFNVEDTTVINLKLKNVLSVWDHGVLFLQIKKTTLRFMD